MSNLDAYWMPFTGNRGFKKDPRIIVQAEGAYFTDDHGRRILDAGGGDLLTYRPRRDGGA